MAKKPRTMTRVRIQRDGDNLRYFKRTVDVDTNEDLTGETEISEKEALQLLNTPAFPPEEPKKPSPKPKPKAKPTQTPGEEKLQPLGQAITDAIVKGGAAAGKGQNGGTAPPPTPAPTVTNGAKNGRGTSIPKTAGGGGGILEEPAFWALLFGAGVVYRYVRGK